MEKKTFEKIQKNVVTYWYDDNKGEIAYVKIGMVDPKHLQAVASVAVTHIPAMTALRKENGKLFTSVKLDLPNLPIELCILDKIRD